VSLKREGKKSQLEKDETKRRMKRFRRRTDFSNHP